MGVDNYDMSSCRADAESNNQKAMHDLTRAILLYETPLYATPIREFTAFAPVVYAIIGKVFASTKA